MTSDNEKKIIESAISNFNKNEINIAKTLFYKTLLINPDPFEALLYLGLISLKNSKLEDAEYFFTRASRTNENDHSFIQSWLYKASVK